jgi:hypothetical protein
MRTSRYLAVAAVAVTVLATPAIAHADPATAAGAVLTVGSPNGANVNPGDGLSAGLKSSTQATFTSTAGGSTGVFCNTSVFAGTVSSNPSAPGTASGSVTTQSFSNCTTNIVGTTSVIGITVDNLPYTVSISSATKLATVSGTVQTTVRLRTIFATTATCIYRPTGTITGTTSNIDNSLTFTDQQFSRQTGSSSLCFASAFWTTTYQPVVDTSQGNGRVFVN